MLIFPRDKPRKIILIPAEMPFSWFQKLWGRAEGKYYIKMDGLHDDVFFNDAFESLPKNPGGVVIQEAGTALITGIIEQVSSSKLMGRGASSIIEASGALFMMLQHGNGAAVGSEDIEICHITFKGEGADTDWAIHMPANAGVYNDRPNIHHCRFLNILGPNQVISILNSRYCSIADNYFEDIFAGPTVGAQGGWIILARNIVINPHDAGLAVLEGYASAPSRVSIVGNVIDGNGTGGEIDLAGVYDVSVVGNVVRNSAQDGVSIYKFPTLKCKRATITGNVFEDCDRFGIHVQAEHFTIAGNIIINNGWCGVWMDEDSKYGTISGNTILDNGQDGVSLNRAAVRVEFGRHINISGNILSDTQGGGATQQYGIYINTGSSDITVGANEIQDNLVAPVGSAVAGEPQERGHNLDYADPVVRVYNTGVQNIPDDTTTFLNFNTERFDLDGMWAIGQPSRLVAKTAGKYRISATVGVESNATGQREARIRRTLAGGGSAYIARHTQDAPAGGMASGINISALYHLNLNDYVEVSLYQNSGGALNTVVESGVTPTFMMERVTS